MQAAKEKRKSFYNNDNTTYIDGYIRLIEGIILSALDKISISVKWENMRIMESMIRHKANDMKEIREWLNSDNCGIWLGVYSRETGISAKQIKKSLKRVLRKSTKYINKLCKEKNIDLTKPVHKFVDK